MPSSLGTSHDKQDTCRHNSNRSGNTISLEIDAETLERIAFLAEHESISIEAMATRLLVTEAESEAGRADPRKYLYR